MRVPASGQSNIPLSLKSEKVVNAVNPEQKYNRYPRFISLLLLELNNFCCLLGCLAKSGRVPLALHLF